MSYWRLCLLGFLSLTASAFAKRSDNFIYVNEDSFPDVCHRTSEGIVCWLGLGDDRYAPPVLWTRSFSDKADWNKPYYGKTVQFADVNGDGMADVCGRAGTGIVCELSDGRCFKGATNWSEVFSNAEGWAVEPYYETIELRDLNNDGRADIRGFGPKGHVRLFSNGSKFVN